MKRLLIFVCALLTVAFASAAEGPIRVLYLGKEGADATRHAHVLMRDLGRDAIWFDYTSDPALVTPEWIVKFDAVLLDAPKENFKSLAAVDEKKIIVPNFTQETTVLVKSVREGVLVAVGEARKKNYEAFLAQREPEKREANPNVANYERRPEPLTVQEPFSVKGSKERTQVAPDLRLELFASDPDIAKPIAFAWDERGRLWVCESRGYPHGVARSGEGIDDVKICEDTDGDGKADKFTVFADKLNLPTSLVFANGGIIVSQPPRFLFLADTNGDDKADVRQEIMTGWSVNDTHAQANNLHYGYDNWLYGCVGYSGFNGEVGGKQMRFAQGTYRFKADGSALEFLHQFSNNSWGQSANDAGDQFGGTANGAPIFYGGIPAIAAPPGFRVTSARQINVEKSCHTITPNFRQVDFFGGYTAAAGSAFIYSANLPPRLQGHAMVCEPTMKVIALMNVQPKGAGYVAKDGFNLVASADEWMSPVFSEVGPDGAVWFSDWQNFIIQHNPTPNLRSGGYSAQTGVGGAHVNPLRDHERGRIYRVVWEKAQKPAITSLKGASTEALVNALSSDNQFWRVTAQRLLVEGKKTDAAESLKKIVATKDSGVGAVHALWSLHGLGQLDDKTHLAGLLAKDSRVRRAATRALGNDDHAKTLFFSAGVVTDPDLVTRLAAFIKLGDFSTAKEIQSVVTSLAKNPAHRSDEWLSDATRLLGKKHKTDAYKEGPNLLPNPGLETVGADGLPEGWKRRDYAGLPGNTSAEWTVVTGAGNVHSGERALRCITRDNADTSFYADVELKPNTTYRLSGWVKGHALRGKISFNDHLGRAETDRAPRGDSDWTLVEVDYNSGNVTKTSINILHVAVGDGYFDDVKLCELLPMDAPVGEIVGLAKRGEDIFHNHVARCVLCHSLKGNGSTVGPPLDGIATRATPDYMRESLLEPSKVIAKGFEGLGTLSPMPPMADIFSAQEIEDILAYLRTLK
jgi:putative membrane-bound dehydrogenase-like protein